MQYMNLGCLKKWGPESITQIVLEAYEAAKAAQQPVVVDLHAGAQALIKLNCEKEGGVAEERYLPYFLDEVKVVAKAWGLKWE